MPPVFEGPLPERLSQRNDGVKNKHKQEDLPKKCDQDARIARFRLGVWFAGRFMSRFDALRVLSRKTQLQRAQIRWFSQLFFRTNTDQLIQIRTHERAAE